MRKVMDMIGGGCHSSYGGERKGWSDHVDWRSLWWLIWWEDDVTYHDGREKGGQVMLGSGWQPWSLVGDPVIIRRRPGAADQTTLHSVSYRSWSLVTDQTTPYFVSYPCKCVAISDAPDQPLMTALTDVEVANIPIHFQLGLFFCQ